MMAHLMLLLTLYPLQIGVEISIIVSFTFSQGFPTPAFFSFSCFCELSFQRSHWRVFASQTFFLSSVCLCVFVVGGVLLGFAKVFS